jgi:hypothetical protein
VQLILGRQKNVVTVSSCHNDNNARTCLVLITASCASVTWTRGILHWDINSAQLQYATEYPQVPRLSLYTLTYVTGRCHLQSTPLPSLYEGSSVFATTGSRHEADFLEPSVGWSAIVPEFSLVSALDEGGYPTPHPGRLIPGREKWYSLYNRLGGPQGQSGRLWKFLSQPGLDSWTVQAVASRYTDCTIPVRPEFQGNPGIAFVADITFPETRSNFNGPKQASTEGWGGGAHSHVASCQKWLLLLLIGVQPRHKPRRDPPHIQPSPKRYFIGLRWTFWKLPPRFALYDPWRDVLTITIFNWSFPKSQSRKSHKCACTNIGFVNDSFLSISSVSDAVFPSLKQNLNPTHCFSIRTPRISLNKRKNKHPLRSKARGRVTAAKLTRLNPKRAIQHHQVAESNTTSRSRSQRSVR